jgi:NAD(P)-dependent dehydrogenase (short-subunit alcohol dehydrogenase family)
MGEELSGKVAIVTGGAGGIGRGIVELFAEEGADVVIADIDEARGQALEAELGAATAFKRTDVSDADDVQQAVDLAVERFGGLHIICNNAGIGGPRHRFLDDELLDFEAQMRVNLFGVMVGCQRAGRHMARHGGGSIINTTSIGGINAGAGLMTYRASKAAVIHLTRCIAVDLPTAINATYDQSRIIQKMQPLQRVGSPRDVANAAVFLASERSAQVTGIVLPVDGGTTAGPPPTDVRELLATRPSDTPT